MTLFTADQLVAHAVGDYIIQSDWMADNKTKQHFAAAVHAITYTLPFLLITLSLPALAAICLSHFLVDRYRLAKYVVWLKNGPMNPPGHQALLKPITATGYPDTKPIWLSTWLLIIADNIIHVCCNALAIAYLS